MPVSRAHPVVFWFLFTVIAFLLLWLAWQMWLVTFAGILLAILLRGITDWVSAHTKLSPGVSYAVVCCAIVLLFALAVWLIAPRAISEFAEIAKTIPKSLAMVNAYLSRSDWGRHVVHLVTRAFANMNLGSRVTKWADYVAQGVAGAVVIIVVGFFLGLHPSVYKNGFIRLFNADRREHVRRVLDALAHTLHWWILGQLVPMIFLGAACMIGLWILRVPLAFSLGLLTGVMIFVPYVGALASEIPAALVALVQGPEKMIEVLILYLGVHICEGYILTPLVQRKAVRLPPAITILAQAFMLEIAGILGLIVATPLAAAALVLIRVLYWGEDPRSQTR